MDCCSADGYAATYNALLKKVTGNQFWVFVVMLVTLVNWEWEWIPDILSFHFLQLFSFKCPFNFHVSLMNQCVNVLIRNYSVCVAVVILGQKLWDLRRNLDDRDQQDKKDN